MCLLPRGKAHPGQVLCVEVLFLQHLQAQLKLHELEWFMQVTADPEVTIMTTARPHKPVLASTPSSTHHTLGLNSGRKVGEEDSTDVEVVSSDAADSNC